MSNVLDGWEEFPKIGLSVDGKKKYYPLREAIPLWDSGFQDVRSAGDVLLQDGSVRIMTEEENREFQDRVDTYSASK